MTSLECHLFDQREPPLSDHFLVRDVHGSEVDMKGT